MNYNYSRRRTSTAKAGKTAIGGDFPIRVQTMLNVSTLDTEGCVAQALAVAEAGSELIRLTTQGVREADNMGVIRERLREEGCEIPLVADVHFNPAAAFAAAGSCEKVRINPGNFVDAARTFRKLEFTDEEYAEEIGRIRKALVPFLELCRKNSVCIRLGVNHGSLSDRIMSRYGDTPAGMVESVMEYLRICREENFDNIVISVKASNTTVMVATVRLLVKEMEREGMAFPLHLGVTEAGDGEDGRVKSAVGIGTLLLDGIGDTIRVSLSEQPECELPVARALRDFICDPRREAEVNQPWALEPATSSPADSLLSMEESAGVKAQDPAVAGLDFDIIHREWHHVDAGNPPELFTDSLPVVMTSMHPNRTGEIRQWIDTFVAMGGRNPVIVSLFYPTDSVETLQVQAGAEFGSLLLDGYISGMEILAPLLDQETIDRVALTILQATRRRITRTEYIACPGCGRTLFDLQATLAQVKAATSHLKGLKIGVMGCIVNGPGEMADADYGYVGAGPGRVSIYKGKECVEKNIPAEEALPRLLALISANEGKQGV